MIMLVPVVLGFGLLLTPGFVGPDPDRMMATARIQLQGMLLIHELAFRTVAGDPGASGPLDVSAGEPFRGLNGWKSVVAGDSAGRLLITGPDGFDAGSREGRAFRAAFVGDAGKFSSRLPPGSIAGRLDLAESGEVLIGTAPVPLTSSEFEDGTPLIGTRLSEP